MRDAREMVSGVLSNLYKTMNKQNKSTTWSETPCVCLIKDSVCRHNRRQQHKEAVTQEVARDAGVMG